jgi:beta-galactosidase
MMKKIVISIVAIVFTVALAQAQGQRTRLIHDWEFFKGDLGGIWEALRTAGEGAPESVPSWSDVTLPHCFNAIDAVDPDVHYYQGAGWYRMLLPVVNPYTNGRTLLHFEGAGQKTEVYIYSTRVGAHIGGYDEWTVDITEAINTFARTRCCRNSLAEKYRW